jgi:GTPase SAR1 family protein
LTPYLPPPVVSTMRAIDGRFRPYVEEASVTAVLSLLLAWVVFRWMSHLGRRGQAVQDRRKDPNDDGGSGSGGGQQYDATVVLVGPSGGGKTTLFYGLLYGRRRVVTVPTIRRNVGYYHSRRGEDNGTIVVVRVVDIPGRSGTIDDVRSSWTSLTTTTTTVAVVLDSTASIGPAVDYLYPLLVDDDDVGQQRQRQLRLVVVCHKCRHPRAKNDRRIRLQLRNELQRYHALQVQLQKQQQQQHQPQSAGDGDDDGTTIDWDGRMNDRIAAWCSTNMDDDDHDDKGVSIDEFRQQLTTTTAN